MKNSPNGNHVCPYCARDYKTLDEYPMFRITRFDLVPWSQAVAAIRAESEDSETLLDTINTTETVQKGWWIFKYNTNQQITIPNPEVPQEVRQRALDGKMVSAHGDNVYHVKETLSKTLIYERFPDVSTTFLHALNDPTVLECIEGIQELMKRPSIKMSLDFLCSSRLGHTFSVIESDPADPGALQEYECYLDMSHFRAKKIDVSERESDLVIAGECIEGTYAGRKFVAPLGVIGIEGVLVHPYAPSKRISPKHQL